MRQSTLRPRSSHRRAFGSSDRPRRARPRHRRGPDRIPADLVDRPPDRRRLAARLHRRAGEGVRDRHPGRRDPRRLLGVPRAARRGRSRACRAIARRAALRRQPRWSRSCRRPCSASLFSKIDQGAPVRAGAGRARVHRRRIRHPVGRAPRSALRRRRCASTTSTTMRWTDALKVGFAQAFALIPGTSRSGATIIGGMLFGLSRTAATEFSFFLAIPTLFAACGYELVQEPRAARRRSDLPAFGVGFVAAFVSAFLVRALADPLRQPPRLRAVRVVPDRLRRADPRHRVRRHRALGLTAAGQPALDRPAVRRRRRARLLVQGDPDQARVRRWHRSTRSRCSTLRMLYSAPFFVAMAWWAGARAEARADRARATGCALARLGFIGYYLVEPARLHGPAVHHRVARAARAVPLPDDRRRAVGAAARQADHAARGRWRSCSRTPASRSSSAHDLQHRRRPRRDAALGGAPRVRERARLRALPRRRGRRDRAARLVALHRVGDARVDGVRLRRSSR